MCITIRELSTAQRFLLVVLGVLGLAAEDVRAHQVTAPGVEVTGHYDFGIGTTDAASAGAVTAKRVETRPIMREGEVLETIPGLIVTQHSGDGKANQYFVRGFNLDQGTDFSILVDGMPVNFPTHGHGQGYADLSFLIPELIGRIDFGKGPYYAPKGDFASAGYADVSLANTLDGGLGSLTLGRFDYRRGLLVNAGGRGRHTVACRRVPGIRGTQGESE